MKRLIIGVAFLIFLAVAPAGADDDGDREEMLDALAKGEIMSLAEILNHIRGVIGDRVVEIEFDRDNGRPIYEIYFIDERGRRGEIEVDARTAEIIGMGEDD